MSARFNELLLTLPEGVRVCHVEAEATGGDTVCISVVLRLSGKRAGQEREVAAALDAIIRADLPTDCTCPEERPDATP